MIRRNRKIGAVNFLASLITLLTVRSAALGYEEDLKTLASVLAEQISDAQWKAVALLDFTDLEGGKTDLGAFLAEELSVALATTSTKFSVLDRATVQALIGSQFGTNDMEAQGTAAKVLAEAAKVDAVVAGTIVPFPETIRISARAIDPATGRAFAVARGEIPRIKGIEDLLSRRPEKAVTQPWPADWDAMATLPPPSPRAVMSFMVEYQRGVSLGVRKREREARKLYQSRDFSGAITLYYEVLSDEPGNWNVHYILANTYLRLNNPEKALEHACIALEILRDSRSYLSVAEAFEQKGDKARSFPWLDTALASGFNLNRKQLDEMFPSLVNHNEYQQLVSKYRLLDR
ncbi:MAG: FlgO family outer membrane protein [Candidatus Hadarchaeum sp.]